MSSNLIIAVTGGVAAYKSAALTSQLVQEGHQVRAVMTTAAMRFLGPATLAALTGKSVVTGLDDPQFPLGPHIELARDADLLCVAPATANFLAKADRANFLVKADRANFLAKVRARVQDRWVAIGVHKFPQNSNNMSQSASKKQSNGPSRPVRNKA